MVVSLFTLEVGRRLDTHRPFVRIALSWQTWTTPVTKLF